MADGKSRAKAGRRSRGARSVYSSDTPFARVYGRAPAPFSQDDLDRGAPRVNLVAGLHAHAPAVVGADVDGLAGAVDAGARGVLLGAQPVAAARGVPGEAGVLAGDGMVDLALLAEGDVVAPPH